MSIIGIDIGSSTTKIVEYKDEKIASKKRFRKKDNHPQYLFSSE